MTYKVDNKVLVDILDSVYGTITRENDWQEVIENVSSAVPFAKVLLHGRQNDLGYNIKAISKNWDVQKVEQYENYYHTVSPWIDHHKSKRAGEIYTSSEMCLNLSKDYPEFYNDFVMPTGIGSGAAVKLIENKNRFAVITLDYEFEKAALYDDQAKYFLSHLAPHIMRSQKITYDLKLLDKRGKDIKQIINNDPSPVFLLETDGYIELMNNSAEKALRQHRGIKLDRAGKLVLDNKDDNIRLRKLIKESSCKEILCTSRSLGTFPFYVASEPEGPNLITVTTISGCISENEKQLHGFYSSSWRVLITIRYRADIPTPSDELLKKTFGLTNAEARVANALVQEKSPKEMAEQWQLSIYTVRGQLKSALSKLGCHKQSELVRLILTLIK